MPAALDVPPAVEPTPSEVVWRRGGARLLRFQREEPARSARPVVLVPSIINRPYIFDLRPPQSLARHLLAQGLDVYLVDWGIPASGDAHLDLEAYALRSLRAITRAARREAGADAVHLLGYCLGGTFALIAGAAGVSGIASIVALTTPVDLSEPGPMGKLTDARLLDLERLAAGWRIVPGQAVWAAFQALDPSGSSRKLRTVADRSRDAELAARFAAQESWLSDPVPMTGRAVRDVVGRLYRENGLARGTLSLGGAPVRLEAGRAPVLNLIALGDTVVPPAASRPLADLWGGPVETRELAGGHIGVTVGSRAPTHTWPVVARWLTGGQE